MSKITVHVVPHTHWDREWYSPYQRYRMRLVHLMDNLLDILETDPEFKCFTLDGQTIPVLDYLEIRPEKRTAIERFVHEKRLLIGPWHILPDEFLVSGEAHIRNLMTGHRISAEFGFTPKMGYIPDTFGHISQLPQIFAGFGIDNAMFFRGLSRPEGYDSELWWEGADGTRALLHALLPFAGYSNAGPLPEDPDRAVKFMRYLVRETGKRATTTHLLAQCGCDHVEARADLPALIRHLNENAKAFGQEIEYVHDTVLGYMNAVAEEIDPVALETVHGELRSTSLHENGGPVVLPNILSSRIYNKIQNADAQQALERWAEPWSAHLWAMGAEYPRGFLWHAWDLLIQNHPHDSIGGCSVDEVHAQMETRFQWATEIADDLAEERFQLLAERLDLSWLDDDEFGVVVFNGLGWVTNELVTADLDIPLQFIGRLALESVKPPPEWDDNTEFITVWPRELRSLFNTNPPPIPDLKYKGLELRAADGESIHATIEDIVERVAVGRVMANGPCGREYVMKVRATFPAPKLPPCGYMVLAGKLTREAVKHEAPKYPANVMENKHLRVEIQSNGTIDLTDKATGEVFTGLGYLEDGGDCGDGYSYSYPQHDEVFNTLGASPRIVKIENNPAFQRCRIEYDLDLPSGLIDNRRRRRSDRVICPLKLTLTLAEGSPRLDFEAELDNRAKDHRLRIVFPTDIDADVSHSEAQFDVVEHAVHPQQPSKKAWREDQPTTYPQQTFVDVASAKRSLCVMNHGLPEYELIENERREVAVTLLRAVAYLGAGNDPLTIVGGAGPNMPTPEGQCLRMIRSRFSIMPHVGTWDESEVWREAHAFSVRPRAIVRPKVPIIRLTVKPDWKIEAPSGNRFSFLSVEGKNAVLSAVKRADNDETLIVRLFNPSGKPTTATLRFACELKSAERVNLNEEPLGELVDVTDGNTLQVELKSKEVVSIGCDLVIE